MRPWRPIEVDFVSAHATGTKMGDVIEAQAIHAVYGAGPFVTGLKGYMGHTMGSCGAIETIMTLYMMQDGFIAPTLNLEEPDERCAMIRHTPALRGAADQYCGHPEFCLRRRQHEPADQDGLSETPMTLFCRKLKTASCDVAVTLLIWVYFILGFLLLFAPRYVVAWLRAHGSGGRFSAPESALSSGGFFALLRCITPGVDPAISGMRSGRSVPPSSSATICPISIRSSSFRSSRNRRRSSKAPFSMCRSSAGSCGSPATCPRRTAGEDYRRS